MTGVPLDEFKRAMRGLPAQVAVVSSKSADVRIAMTATAVTSLSAEPPQLLVCIHQMARAAAVIKDAGAFAVNLLHTGQVDVANQCAMPNLEPENRFDIGSWTLSQNLGQPLLDQAIVNFECSLTAQYKQGTHSIFVGLIEQVRFEMGGRPLLYHDASYREIGELLDALHLEWDNTFLAF